MYLKSECITKMTYQVQFCPENPLFLYVGRSSTDFSEFYSCPVCRVWSLCSNFSSLEGKFHRELDQLFIRHQIHMKRITTNLSNDVYWYLTSVMWKYKTKASSGYRTPWLCLLHIKYQQTKLFASYTVIKYYHRDQNIMTEYMCLPQGICMVAFNHITGDAGVMLFLLDVIYLACQMLIWYHYYCQKKIYFYFFIQLLSTAFVCVCACVLLHATLEMMVLKFI